MSCQVELLHRGYADQAGHSDFERYCAALALELCPYLAPALEKRLVHFAEYRIHADTVIECQAAITHAGILHAESLRRQRRARPAQMLHCECPLFEIAGPASAHSRRNLFERPHQALVELYTEVGVIPGRFWPGPPRPGPDGSPRPVPPCDLLAIRSSLPGKDARFFQDAPDLHQAFLQASDDGHDVLAPHGLSERQLLSGIGAVGWYEQLQESLRASRAALAAD